MIECVEYCQVERHGVKGIRITFVFEDAHVDEFEFFDQSDMDHMVKLMAEGVHPEGLMVAIRDCLNFTVH